MPRRGAWIVSTMLCLCLPVTIAGCAQGGGTSTLAPLHIAGLSHLPGLASLVDNSTMGGLGFAIFQPAGDATPHFLLNTNYQLDVVGLDGSGERQLATQTKCNGVVAVTADGQWGACIGYKAGFSSGTADQLEMVSLAAESAQHHQFGLLGPADSYFGLVWSPDASRLAVVAVNGPAGTCAVQVYTAGPSYGSLELTASFTSDVFASSGRCHVAGLGWSSDSSQLEIVAGSADALLLDDHVSVTSPGLAASANAAIPAGEFTSIPVGAPFIVAAQNPRTGALALADDGNQTGRSRLMYYSATSRQTGTWFTIPDTSHFLSRMAWTPDGQHLLLLVIGSGCLDNCAHALPDMYLYTPPATT